MLFLGDVFSELVVISMFLQLAVMDFSSFTLSNFPSCSCEYNIHYWPLYEEPHSQIWIMTYILHLMVSHFFTGENSE